MAMRGRLQKDVLMQNRSDVLTRMRVAVNLSSLYLA